MKMQNGQKYSKKIKMYTCVQNDTVVYLLAAYKTHT